MRTTDKGILQILKEPPTEEMPYPCPFNKSFLDRLEKALRKHPNRCWFYDKKMGEWKYFDEQTSPREDYEEFAEFLRSGLIVNPKLLNVPKPPKQGPSCTGDSAG